LLLSPSKPFKVASILFIFTLLSAFISLSS
jgi:hypothetical protein